MFPIEIQLQNSCVSRKNAIKLAFRCVKPNPLTPCSAGVLHFLAKYPKSDSRDDDAANELATNDCDTVMTVARRLLSKQVISIGFLLEVQHVRVSFIRHNYTNWFAKVPVSERRSNSSVHVRLNSFFSL